MQSIEREKMQAQRINHMFRFHYTKSSGEIVEKMKLKIASLQEKIEERKGRIKKIRDEFGITDAVYIDLLEQARDALKKNDTRMSYIIPSAKNDARTLAQDGETTTIGAGTVNSLLTETDFIREEESQVRKLDLIARNLKDEERDWSQGRKVGWALDEEELKYLGF